MSEQHERTRAIDGLRKSERLEKLEKRAEQVLHKTGNDLAA
jgi:hypothetical protein